MNNSSKKRITIQDIVLIGVMVAVIEVSKAALSFLPNIELTSFWIIMFTIFFGWRVILTVPVFIILEGTIYGFGLWWLMYIYIWPLLSLLAYFFRKIESAFFWSILSAGFGLAFGFLCSFPYFFMGMSSGGIRNGFYSAFAWWVAGIPWDFVHCIGNFVIMLVLYYPILSVMKRIKKQGF